MKKISYTFSEKKNSSDEKRNYISLKKTNFIRKLIF